MNYGILYSCHFTSYLWSACQEERYLPSMEFALRLDGIDSKYEPNFVEINALYVEIHVSVVLYNYIQKYTIKKIT